MESRVCANTDRLLAIFNESDVRATFFVLGWVAERYPHLVKAIAAEGHEIASHGYAHRLVYDLTPRQFREDIRRSKGVIQAATSAPVHGLPRAELLDHAAVAVGARRPHRGRLPLRLEHLSDPPRSATASRSRRAIRIVLHRGAGLVEAPGSTVRVGPDESPDRRRRLFPHPAVRSGRAGGSRG